MWQVTVQTGPVRHGIAAHAAFVRKEALREPAGVGPDRSVRGNVGVRAGGRYRAHQPSDGTSSLSPAPLAGANSSTGLQATASPAGDAPFEAAVIKAFEQRQSRARVVLDRGHAVVWANEMAHARLAVGAPVLLAGTRLLVADRHEEASFQAFLSALDDRPRRRALSGGDGGWLMLTAWRAATPCRERGEAPGAASGEPASHIFLEFAAADRPGQAASNGMAEQYGLTRAECAVVDVLAALRTPTQAADVLNVSINTVRTHVRRLFAKLDVKSQIELVSLAAAFAATE